MEKTRWQAPVGWKAGSAKMFDINFWGEKGKLFCRGANELKAPTQFSNVGNGECARNRLAVP